MRPGNRRPPTQQGPALPDEVRVSTIELFFDLVFVFAITQLTSLLAGQPTVAGLVRVALVFGNLWWMYGGYAWLTASTAWFLAAGVGCYVAGLALFRRLLGTGPVAARLAIAVAVLPTAAVGLAFSPEAQLGVLAAVVVGGVVAESAWEKRGQRAAAG